jgi:hypothetical protein
MPKKGKMCLFKSYCMPILTYGAETWIWTKADISRLMAADMKFLRSIQAKKRERMRNEKTGESKDKHLGRQRKNNNKMVWTCFKNEQRKF